MNSKKYKKIYGDEKIDSPPTTGGGFISAAKYSGLYFEDPNSNPLNPNFKKYPNNWVLFLDEIEKTPYTQDDLENLPRFNSYMAAQFFDLSYGAFMAHHYRANFNYIDGSHIEPLRVGKNFARMYCVADFREMAASLHRKNIIDNSQHAILTLRFDSFSTLVHKKTWYMLNKREKAARMDNVKKPWAHDVVLTQPRKPVKKKAKKNDPFSGYRPHWDHRGEE
jgi:hypothetical protein